LSIHLIQCVAVLPIRPPEKLALLCFADDSRDAGRHASPGFETVVAWVGRSPARVYELLSRLKELRLLEQVGRGGKNHRAVFVVLPDGCCEAHGKVPSGTSTVDPDDLGSASWESEADSPLSGSDSSEAEAGTAAVSASEQPEPDSTCGFSEPPEPEASSASSFAVSASSFAVSASGQPDPSRKTPLGTSHREPPSLTPPAGATPAAHIPEPSIGIHDRRPRLLCGQCENGWHVDSDGRPLAKCLACHPAHRAAASA
jgi:hypothetical protein